MNAKTMNFSITTGWNSAPITDHRPFRLTLSDTEDKEHVFVEIDAPFFNDSAPLTTSPPGPYAGLWNYEVVELFFLSSSTNRYVQLEFSPHGYYFVILFSGSRNEFKLRLPLADYTVEHPSSDRWIGRVHIPRSLFPADVDRFNAAAMHGEKDGRAYEMLYPAPSNSTTPDFHRLELFQSINFDSLLSMNGTDGDSWTDKKF